MARCLIIKEQGDVTNSDMSLDFAILRTHHHSSGREDAIDVARPALRRRNISGEALLYADSHSDTALGIGANTPGASTRCAW
jgi:hypothetical protein